MGESSFWYRPTRVVPDQRPLNGRCCCCWQQVTKRHLRRSKSLVSVMLWGGSDSEFELDKAKNVCQTEILVDLREAILQVARHFQSIDPRNSRVVRTRRCVFYAYWSVCCYLQVGWRSFNSHTFLIFVSLVTSCYCYCLEDNTVVVLITNAY